MASKIRILDERAINQIAAGEVIENPSSVVKELMENALDASAGEIFIEIKAGGRQLVRVADDGIGMNGDDALLCLERHATSKIRALSDLDSVLTMGFRGEAVPSIASVSKFTLTTSTEGREGTLISVEGGNLMGCSVCARARGTTVEVKSLFYNTPVRRKFQRSLRYDSGEIVKVVSLLALAHPNVKFCLVIDDKEFFSTPAYGEGADALRLRIGDVLGKSFLKRAHLVESSEGAFGLNGFVLDPTETRPNRTGQHLFINKRAVRSPFISKAVADAYATRLEPRRFPFFVLYLTLGEGAVDVNVHPQKREVRLHGEGALARFLMGAVDSALCNTTTPAATNASLPSPAAPAPTAAFTDDAFPTPKWGLDATVPGIEEEVVSTPTTAPTLFSITSSDLPLWKLRVQATLADYFICKGEGLLDGLPGYDPEEESIVLVDQRACQMRVLYNTLIDTTSGKGVAIQQLLFPITLELSKAEAQVVEGLQEELQAIGLSVRSLGGSSFIVDGIPATFDIGDITDFVVEVVEDLHKGRDPRKFGQEERVQRLAVVAVRAYVRRKKRFDLQQAQGLVDRLARGPSPFISPLGAPTMVCVGSTALAKLFGSG
ncbi:DNA mismatch repair endonuclease MutL, partial [Simkania negevensis]|nr:DNA mismatch repair endonuclease MutL [Simkania negevensis]